MIILGISPLDKDSTVTLVQDGKVLFAAGEERFTRNKLQDGFPARALEAGLKSAGVRAADIDAVAYPFFDWHKETELFSRNLQNEKKFLDATAVDGTQRRIKEDRGKVPLRTEPIHGLSDPN